MVGVGSMLGDGYLMRRGRVSGVTRDRAVRIPQSQVAGKVLGFLLCWVTLVSTGRAKLLGTASAG